MSGGKSKHAIASINEENCENWNKIITREYKNQQWSVKCTRRSVVCKCWSNVRFDASLCITVILKDNFIKKITSFKGISQSPTCMRIIKLGGCFGVLLLALCLQQLRAAPLRLATLPTVSSGKSCCCAGCWMGTGFLRWNTREAFLFLRMELFLNG